MQGVSGDGDGIVNDGGLEQTSSSSQEGEAAGDPTK